MPIDVSEVKDADTTENAEGYITIAPICADFTTGFNTNVPSHNRFRADVMRAVAKMGYGPRRPICAATCL